MLRGTGAEGTAPVNPIDRMFAVAAFAFLLTFIIALNAFEVGGIPIRGFFAVGLLVIAALLYSDRALQVFRDNLLLLNLALALALLGIFVSLLNGASVEQIVTPLMEVHLQAVITILAAGILARVAGARACAYAVVGVVGCSAIVAGLQMLGWNAAWELRASLGPFPKEATDGLNFGERRPVGLSFSPIQLSTQLCLAFAVFAAVRDKLRTPGGADGKPDLLVLIALLMLIAASVAVETRAPIFGAILFLAVYVLMRRSLGFALLLIFGAAILFFLWPVLMGVIEGSAPRVVRTDDNSAVGRLTMAYYGMRLFLDNPIGYGLAFEPADLWGKYWFDLYTMPAPMGVQVTALHNYVASMLNIYGIGLLLVAPIAVSLLRRAGTTLIFFIPYVVQILFHNAGPFFNDNVLWFVIAAIAAASASERIRGGEAAATAGSTRGGWSAPPGGIPAAAPSGGMGGTGGPIPHVALLGSPVRRLRPP